MPKRRFFRFSYYTPETKAGRGLRLHQLRDGDAFIELAAVLHEYGHEYGKLILNFPAPSAAPTTPVDTSFLTASDLLVLTTRPPLHDAVRHLKHPIRRSHTSLEDCVLTAFAAYFEVCARDQVKLAGPLAARCYPRLRRGVNDDTATSRPQSAVGSDPLHRPDRSAQHTAKNHPDSRGRHARLSSD
jgi:hypothetical protein